MRQGASWEELLDQVTGEAGQPVRGGLRKCAGIIAALRGRGVVEDTLFPEATALWELLGKDGGAREVGVGSGPRA
jgi:hypothetical protein